MTEDELKHARIRMLRHADIEKCPFLIMTPEHYREDGSCRCDDVEHDEMHEWGYVWDAATNKWIANYEV